MVAFEDPKIVDVSEYNRKNKAIDFVKMKAQGVRLVILRISHGRVADKRFKESQKNAKGLIPRANYVYLDYYSHRDPTSTAYGLYTDEEWGRVQAVTAHNLRKPDDDGMILFSDMERSQFGEPVDDVRERILVIDRAFLEEMDRLNGKFNGMYHSLHRCSWFDPWFWDRPLWVAVWNATITEDYVRQQVREQGWTGDILIWQFTSHGNGEAEKYGVDSKNDLDLNRWMKSDAEFEKFIGKDNNMPPNILLDIEPLCQLDKRWWTDQLGTSNKTIGSHGCLMTDATMLIRFLLGIDIDPGELNTWLKANGGYYDYNLFVWGVLKKFDSRISFGYRYKRAALDKIDAELAKGMPVIVNVDMNPATPVLDEHWVIVIGKVDGSYIINDPWWGIQFKFEEKYGDPRTGVKIVCTYNFTGAVQPPVEPEPEGDVLFRVKVLIDNLLIRSTPEVKSTNILPGHAIFPGEYDVFEERNGYGRIGVNRWISMSPFYVQKLGGVPALSLEERVAKLEAWVEGHA